MSGITDFSGDGSGSDGTDGSLALPGYTDGSTGIATDSSYLTPKTPDTATTNAIQSMAPVTSANTTSDSGWSSFWQATLGGVIQTAAKVTAVKNGVQPTTGQPIVARPQTNANGLLLIVGVIAVVMLATHKG